MKRYQRFIVRHPLLFPLLSIALGGGYAMWMAALDASPWLGLLFVPLFIIAVGQSLTAANMLQLTAIKALDERCDPVPLLVESAQLLGAAKGRTCRAQLALNHATALIEMGQIEQAYTELQALPTTAFLPGLPLLQAYCHNMAICERERNQLAKAQVWYEQAQRNLSAIQSPSLRAPCENSMRFLTAELALAQGDIDAAEAAVKTFLPTLLREQVSKAWLVARIAAAQGDASSVTYHLDFVIQNGNALYVVRQAREMKAALETEDQE